MRIQLLDQLTANQIAAGEVIERPSSVVKELLENSLDAHAKKLIIDIEGGGARLIKIQDDGVGIHKDDLHLALKRHGTSKIKQIGDLEKIGTLGFRGEALASISSVAKVSLSSCEQNQDTAWQLVSEGDKAEPSLKPTAHPKGTTIAVRSLFFNAPVRRKFLRTEKTEFMNIEETVKRIALSRFDLWIQLTHNQKEIFKLPPATTELTQEKRLARICGKSFVNNSLKIDMEATGLRLYGWIALPEFTRAQNDTQYTYINGRIVRDKTINHAIRQAYQDKLLPNRQPAFVLFLELDPSVVDVNVHPTKSEVRFKEARLIHDFIYHCIKKTLEPYEGLTENANIASYQTHQTKQLSYPFRPSRAVSTSYIQEHMSPYKDLYSTSSKEHYYAPTSSPLATTNSMLGRAIAIIHDSYILAENTKGLVIINIALAHQYIIYNKCVTNLTTGEIESKPLLLPEPIKLSNRAIEFFKKRSEDFLRLGFDMEALDLNKIILRKAPLALQNCNIKNLLLEFFEDINKIASLDFDDNKTLPLLLSKYGSKNIEKQLASSELGLFLSEIEGFISDSSADQPQLPWKEIPTQEIEELF